MHQTSILHQRRKTPSRTVRTCVTWNRIIKRRTQHTWSQESHSGICIEHFYEKTKERVKTIFSVETSHWAGGNLLNKQQLIEFLQLWLHATSDHSEHNNSNWRISSTLNLKVEKKNPNQRPDSCETYESVSKMLSRAAAATYVHHVPSCLSCSSDARLT